MILRFGVVDLGARGVKSYRVLFRYFRYSRLEVMSRSEGLVSECECLTPEV